VPEISSEQFGAGVILLRPDEDVELGDRIA